MKTNQKSRSGVYHAIRNYCDAHLGVSDISRIIADYWLDRESAARYLTSCGIVYSIIPSGWTMLESNIRFQEDGDHVRVSINQYPNQDIYPASHSYSGTYFELANLEYCLKHYRRGLPHWLSFRIGYGQKYFDKLFAMINDDIDLIMRSDAKKEI